MIKDVPPCAPWGTKSPKGAWYQEEALGPIPGTYQYHHTAIQPMQCKAIMIAAMVLLASLVPGRLPFLNSNASSFSPYGNQVQPRL